MSRPLYVSVLLRDENERREFNAKEFRIRDDLLCIATKVNTDDANILGWDEWISFPLTSIQYFLCEYKDE